MQQITLSYRIHKYIILYQKISQRKEIYWNYETLLRMKEIIEKKKNNLLKN